MKDQRPGKGPCPKQTQILIVVEDSLSRRSEGLICSAIFSMGDEDMLSQQVKGFFQDLIHWTFIVRHNQICRIDHYFQAWRLQCCQQCMASFSSTYHVGLFWLN